MKNVLWIIVLWGILSLGITACSNDDGYDKYRYRNFGTVEAIDGDIEKGFDIRLDNGTWLSIENSRYVRFLEDQDRILAVYRVHEELEPLNGDNRFLAVLNDYAKILSKPPVLQSFIDEDPEVREDSIGHDPIRVDEAWFGGKYLNIAFTVARRANTNEVHFINLVADDTEAGDGTVHLYLRHNGYDDVPEPGAAGFVYTTPIVSFDITGLIPEGENSVHITLHWEQYRSSEWRETVEGSDSGTFTPYNKQESTPAADSMTIESDYVK